MSLSFDVTVGGSASTSYADVGSADDLADLRVNGSLWKALSESQKEIALVTASRDLDTEDFLGTRATSTQSMEWPRVGAPAWLDANTIPPRLVAATIELAYSYVPAFGDASVDVLNPSDPASQGVKREKVDTIETEYFDRTIRNGVAGVVPFDARSLSRFPSIVQRLIAPLVRSVVSAGWGNTAVAVRTS
jgi:hypothetical protein